ncbi:Serine/threonine-protein phosphatase 5 [Hondaea fermentalgiana]|uniref:Serine/threonine-protein phosphatase n=1 Tax=Hondaea fermentalgiana TaxID=2315210 RepID=A0A2R5GSC1_9STRA|nr:Serine/threonine-protein phosphatase 5 [Hondaea fermentalgiana]|eukprot:GBG31261.1 Serine/threonine-protein phosphatase 5 [Hondaea fermentalgiana]
MAADPVSSATQQRADELKGEANKYFGQAQYAQAIAVYSDAIELSPSAVLYSNRAFAHLRTEAFGLAIEDARKALALDPRYVKAYYRLGSAYVALNKYRHALKVFKQLAKLAPKDRDVRTKLTLCEKEVKRAAFEAAIAVEAPKPLSETLDLDSMTIPDNYEGPRLGDGDEVTADFISGMLDWMRDEKLLPKRIVASVLVQLKRILASLPSLVDVDIPEDEQTYMSVLGDTHGQFYDLLNIFKINDRPSPTRPYLWNGDLCDRGSWSFETTFTAFAYKVLYPQSVFINRGNHETQNMNKMYGFEGEVMKKYDANIMALFTECFRTLPYAHVIEKKVLVVHGGLFKDDGVKLDDIRKIPRGGEPPESGIGSDILWSDPQPFNGRGPSKRGVGLSFGPDITERFLKDNNLDLVIRSHEVREEGFLEEHDGKLITVFSAPNYCDQMGNKGALIRFRKNNMKPDPVTFEAVPHPDLKPMAYASNLGMFGL